MGKFLNALPIFLGVVFGAALFYSKLPPEGVFFILLVGFLTGAAIFKRTDSLMRTRPTKAVDWWYGALIFPIALLSGLGWGAAYLATLLPSGLAYLPDVLFETAKIQAASGDLTKLILGALSAFLGATFLKGADNADSGFWPSGRFKSQLQKHHLGLNTRIPEDQELLREDVLHAVERPTLRTGAPSGWGHAAMKARAALVEQGLAAAHQ